MALKNLEKFYESYLNKKVNFRKVNFKKELNGWVKWEKTRKIVKL